MFHAPLRRGHHQAAFVLGLLLLSLPVWAAEKIRFHADDYQIDAVLNPHDHKIAARVRVKITALDDLNIVTFQLHNDLRLAKVTDASGKPLTADRMPQDSIVRVSLKNTLPTDQSTTLTFKYEEVLDSAIISAMLTLKLSQTTIEPP